jgi:hypothetical protein
MRLDRLDSQRLVVAAFLVASATPIVIAATHHVFWERAHSQAPVVSLAFFGLLAGLAFRKRWAWVVLVVIEGAILVSFAFDFASVVGFICALVSVALLLSPQMRGFVRRHPRAA